MIKDTIKKTALAAGGVILGLLMYGMGNTVSAEEPEETTVQGGYVDFGDNSGPDFVKPAGLLNVMSSLPSYYRNTNVPSVRNQSPYGTCWAHAAVFAAEAELIQNNGCSTSIDLSELHLAYFVYNPVAAEFGKTDNESHTEVTNYLDAGGNQFRAIGALSSWMGFVTEETAPYSLKYTPLDESYAFDYDVYHLENAFFVNKDDITGVKQLIKDYGSVIVNYYSSNSYYDAVEHSVYYYPDDGQSSNHAVSIVGWDDNYSRYNFNTSYSSQSDYETKYIPEADGAWIVRNSWGPYWGESGYFYMSYYDKSISTVLTAFDAESADKYDNNYQYDMDLSGAYASDFVNYVHRKVANVFDVSATSSNETLEAVSFFTYEGNCDYEIDIYTGLTDGSNPESGTLATTLTGSISYPGFYTIPTDVSVKLSPGTKFSVVVNLIDENGNSLGVAPEHSVGILSAAAEEGQSFYYNASGDRWYDYGYLSNVNFRIKAFTNVSEAGITLSKDSVTFEQAGDTDTITATITPDTHSGAALSWTSSNTKVATVDQNGKITAVGSGDAVITISAPGDSSIKSAQCKVHVHKYVDVAYLAPTYYAEGHTAGTYCSLCNHVKVASTTIDKLKVPATTSLTYSTIAPCKVKFTWSSVDVASGYKVELRYYDTSEIIYSGEISDNTATFKSMQPDKDYVLYVYAYVTDGTNKAYSAAKAVYCEPADLQVTNLTVTELTANTAKVSWTGVTGAEKYKVVVKNASGAIIYSGWTTGNFYDITAGLDILCPESSYQVDIIPYCGEDCASAKSVKFTTSKPANVSNVTALGIKTNEATLNWGSVSGAIGYYVFQYDPLTGEWTQIDIITSTSCKITGLSSGTAYKFAVAAYGSTSSGVISTSEDITTVNVITKLTDITTLKVSATTSSSATLAWSKVSGATGYNIYQYNPATNAWKWVKATTSTSAAITGLSSGTAYKFAVKPYTKIDGTTVTSINSKTVDTVTKLPNITTFKTGTIQCTTVALSWNKITGATGYWIYKYNPTTKVWSRVKTTSSTSCTITGLTPGTSYQFAVKPCKTVNGTTVTSAASKSVTAITKIYKVTGLKATSATKTTISLGWNKVTGATGYYVYRYDTAKKVWTKVASVTGTTYTVKNLTANTSYQFSIKAYKKVGTETVTSISSSDALTKRTAN